MFWYLYDLYELNILSVQQLQAHDKKWVTILSAFHNNVKIQSHFLISSFHQSLPLMVQLV